MALLALAFLLVALGLAAPAPAAAALTITHGPARADNDPTPSLAGTGARPVAEAGLLTVELVPARGAKPFALRVASTPDGTWSAEAEAAVPDGRYLAVAKQGRERAERAFTLDTVAPTLTMGEAAASTAGKAFALEGTRGTAEGDRPATATVDGAPASPAPVGTSGWALALAELTPGQHTIAVAQRDAAGNTSGPLTHLVTVIDARFTVEPNRPVLGRPVTLTAAAAPEAVRAYAWDLDGDPEPEARTRALSLARAERATVRLVVIAQDRTEAFMEVDLAPRDPRPTLTVPGAYTGSDGLIVGGRLGEGVGDDAQVDVQVSGLAERQAAFVAAGAFSAFLPELLDSGEHLARAFQSADGTTEASDPLAFTVIGFDGLAEPDGDHRRVTFTATTPTRVPSGLALAWDLDGDGSFDDGRGREVSRRYAYRAEGEVALQVTWQEVRTTTTQLLLPQEAPLIVERPSLETPKPFDQSGPGAPPPPPPAPPVLTPPRTPPPPPRRAPAPRKPTLLSPFPTVRMAGQLTPAGARVRLLAVKAPRGARIRATCRGRGCPVRARTLRARRTSTLRLRAFERHLRAGIAIEVFVTAPGRIGKHTRFVIARGKAPGRRDRCIAANGRRPVACP